MAKRKDEQLWFVETLKMLNRVLVNKFRKYYLD